jgi:hypothetical protein
MGSGALLAGSRTVGLTTSTIGRPTDVTAADDSDALLGIEGLPGCDDSVLTFQNNGNSDLTLTVETSRIDVTSPTSGKAVSVTIPAGGDRTVEFAPDTDTRDDVVVTADIDGGEHVELTRTVTLTPVEPAVYQLTTGSGWLGMGVRRGETDVRQYSRYRRNVRRDWEVVLNDDCTYRLRNAGTGTVLSVEDPASDGSSLVVEPWDESDWQRWTILPNGDGSYRFRNVFSGDVATVSGSGRQNDDVVQRPWQSGSAGTQSWTFDQTGTVGYTTVDTTGAGSATFDTENLTIDAAGTDMWTTADEYGAVVRSDIRGNTVARTTVQSQENTGDWAKAGLMFANDAASTDSVGDVKVNVTPANGFEMTWDSDGDGFHDSSTVVGESTYPCDLRLTRYWGGFTGEYSTDGGATWTTIDTVWGLNPNQTQDVALVVCSFDSSTTSRVEFGSFTVQ